MKQFPLRYYVKYKKYLKPALIALLGIAYFIYFGFAIAESWESETNFCYGVRFLFLLTVFTVGSILYSYILMRYCGKSIDRHLIKPLNKVLAIVWSRRIVRWWVKHYFITIFYLSWLLVRGSYAVLTMIRFLKGFRYYFTWAVASSKSIHKHFLTSSMKHILEKPKT